MQSFEDQAMNWTKTVSRRRFLRASGAACSALALPLPVWAGSNQAGAVAASYPDHYELHIGPTPVTIDGRTAMAQGINGSVPGPLLRFREGRPVTLNVSNGLHEDSSLHWHGLLLPPGMDGVPGISFDGIAPGETFRYEYVVSQSGTYWYHSHSGLQEQSGVYGPIIIDPDGEDPVRFDREFVILLSDWSFESPDTLLANLKKMDSYYNYQRRTLADFALDVRRDGLRQTIAERRNWGAMRMSATDIADITGAGYTFLLNGLDASANWTGLFEPGDRLRLRIINGSAMTFFNVRIPGLPMTVVQADGQNIEPVETDEFQIGVAETYDVIVEPRAELAYTIFAEAMDRSGFARGTLAQSAAISAQVPALRERPLLTMADMGMDHAMDHADVRHDMPGMKAQEHNHRRGPGVAGVTMYPRNRLDDPGVGLDLVDHRVLAYSQLRSLTPNKDQRAPQRTLEIHLTGNMHRYMWSFDGVKYSEVDAPIEMCHGERLRMIFVNDTMMSHPIHLHGMFVEIVNGNGAYNPLKHTVVVKPAERIAVDLTPDPPGAWAFHCHMLYHMNAGMMQSVIVKKSVGAVT
jgi:FtsP/CotA-like multicopper oxidase with cupredoxin domain